MARKSQKDKDQELISEAIGYFEKSLQYDHDNRIMALEDVRFVHEDDAQWDEDSKQRRQGRPTMTFDKTSGAVDQVVGDMLQNAPGIKVRAMEDGDTDVADIYTGLIRAIESTSHAKRAYNNAGKFAISGGFGAWQICTDWKDDESFFQDILIEPIMNPFSVVFDWAAELPSKQDGRFMFKFTDLDAETFKDLYPNGEGRPTNFRLEGMRAWFTGDTVRVADYYRKVPAQKTLYLLSNGNVVDSEAFNAVADVWAQQGVTVKRERKTTGHNIEYYKITAGQILETKEYAGKYFPIVPVWGKQISIEGLHRYRGIVRKAKDPQRLLNYEMNAHIEVVAEQPKAPYLMTAKMIAGHEKQWQRINVSNDPVMIYEPDPAVQGGGPRREAPPQVSQGQLTMIELSTDMIKSATNLYDASLGARSNETSGKAIMARDRQGDIATYEFFDELAEAKEMTGRILVDMIPKIYDTEREIRILGEDMTEEIVKVNHAVKDYQSGDWVTQNDLARGKYDITVSKGPSYTTKRQETADQLGSMMKDPEMLSLLGDIWVKSLDLVGGDEVIKRLRKIGIQKGFVEPNEEEQRQMAPQKAQQEQMQKTLENLAMRAKQAEIAKDEADTAKTQAETQTEQTIQMMNVAKARLEAAEAASKAGDVQATMMNLRLAMQAFG